MGHVDGLAALGFETGQHTVAVSDDQRVGFVDRERRNDTARRFVRGVVESTEMVVRVLKWAFLVDWATLPEVSSMVAPRFLRATASLEVTTTAIPEGSTDDRQQLALQTLAMKSAVQGWNCCCRADRLILIRVVVIVSSR